MFNKFKNNEVVIVNGYGECDNKKYVNRIGIVICRDPYYKDYYIKFLNLTTDWLEEKNLEKF